MSRFGWTGRLTVTLWLLGPVFASAQTPLGTEFTYQGQLRSAGGPANGLHDLRFRLYDAAVVGTQVGPTLCLDNVSVSGGLLAVSLDFGAQFAGEGRFVEIDVRPNTGLDCGTPAGFVALAPRQPLTAAPNALNADRLDGFDSTVFLQSVPNPLSLSGSQPGGHIIQGTNSSATIGSVGVSGVSTAPLGSTYGGYFRSAANGGQGVYAEGGFLGVHGQATNATGTAYGGYFQSASSGGRGMVGFASAGSGETYGVWGESNGTSGAGVFGWAAAGTGLTYGGRFQCDSASGLGVFGLASANTGPTRGVYGRSHSPSGLGGFFQNLALGNDFDVELSGPNGAVNTPGFVYREYTAGTPSAAIPIAYGSVDSAGAILSGTANFTVAHPATGQYDITVSGETYSNAGFTVTITPVSNTPRVTNVADAGAGFRVNMWNLTPTLVDNAFQFTIWKSDPN